MPANRLRLSLALAFAAALTLTGLSRPRVADAQADTTTINQTIPIIYNTFVPCANGGAGEFVELTGEMHMVIHATSNDNHGTSNIHSSFVRLTGVGLTTGDTYRGVGASGTSFTFQSDGDTSALTSTSNTLFVGPGPDNNLVLRQVFHFTIVDGEMTSFQNNATFDCK
jgi:hypothetical protein